MARGGILGSSLGHHRRNARWPGPSQHGVDPPRTPTTAMRRTC